MKYRSAVLEGALQVYARAVPWRLAEGRVYSVQSRYDSLVTTLVIIIQEYSAGARACLGRRCELLRFN